MGNRKRIILYSAFLILIIAGFFFYIRRNSDEFEKILSLRLIDFVVISFLVIVSQILNGLIIKVLVEFFDVRLKASEWFGLSVINRLGNYLPLQIGPVLRAAYLKKVHNFPYTAFISSTGVHYIIIILSSGLIGMLGMTAMYYMFNTFSLVLFIFCALIFLGALFLIIFSPTFKSSDSKFRRRISNVIEGWNSVKKNRKLLLKLFCIYILTIFVLALRIFYASFALGYNFPFLYALLIAVPVLLSGFLIIVPAGLGVREAVMGISSKLLVGTGLSGVVIGSLDRLVTMAWVIVLGSVFGLMLSRRLAKERSQ